MRKIKILALSLILGSAIVNANPVNVTVAQKVAENFFSTKHAGAISSSLAYTESDANAVPVFYVFNVNTNKGFVIVTAEDAANPVIGYSDEGAFVVPTNQNNNNVYYWLQERKKEVIALRTQHVSASLDINNAWSSYTNNTRRMTHTLTTSRDSVLPLCSSSWDQSPYYNAYCPGTAPNQSVTGCVATAMAQIMRYWSYPSVGTGSSQYDDNMSENYGVLSAEYDTSHYVWSEMQLTPLGRANNQIAKLMYDCGVSVDMDYSPTGSGAYVMGGPVCAYNSYTEYFGYDASTINTAQYDPSQQSAWIALLEGELNIHRPMQFQGTDPSEGGHSWVCDGYSATNEMHMNWGWSGYDDGYFTVTLLNPDVYDFSEDIAVIYGIQPPPGALSVQKISANTAINVYPNPSHGVFNFNLTNNSGNYQVRIYNVLGQEVNTNIISTTNNTINLSTQPKGIYIYKLLTEQGVSVSTGRLVVE